MIFIVILNIDFKKVVYDSIPRDQYCNLAYRSIQGILTFFCTFEAIKYLPLVLVAIVVNMSPICIAIFGYFWLHESLHKFDIFQLILSFAAVVIIIVENNKEGSDPVEANKPKDYTSIETLLVPLVLLLMIPFLTASGTIAMR